VRARTAWTAASLLVYWAIFVGTIVLLALVQIALVRGNHVSRKTGAELSDVIYAVNIKILRISKKRKETNSLANRVYDLRFDVASWTDWLFFGTRGDFVGNGYRGKVEWVVDFLGCDDTATPEPQASCLRIAVVYPDRNPMFDGNSVFCIIVKLRFNVL
jgi:hypothetical protein